MKIDASLSHLKGIESRHAKGKRGKYEQKKIKSIKGPKFSNVGHAVFLGPTVVTSNLAPSRAKELTRALNAAMRENTIKPKSKGYARRKGHSFERDVAIMLRDIFPKARRQLEYHADDAKGVDIQNTAHYLFQCKKFKNYAPLSCIEEIQFDPAFGDVPVLVTAADNKPALACLPFDYFLTMLKIIKGV